jgi:hypothetical protein
MVLVIYMQLITPLASKIPLQRYHKTTARLLRRSSQASTNQRESTERIKHAESHISDIVLGTSDNRPNIIVVSTRLTGVLTLWG